MTTWCGGEITAHSEQLRRDNALARKRAIAPNPEKEGPATPGKRGLRPVVKIGVKAGAKAGGKIGVGRAKRSHLPRIPCRPDHTAPGVRAS